MSSRPKDRKVRYLTVDLVGDQGLELYEVLKIYKTLSRQTWTDFILSCMAEVIEKENDMIASAIRMYINTRSNVVTKGRPPGTPMSDAHRIKLSLAMKERWALKKAQEKENEKERERTDGSRSGNSEANDQEQENL